MKRSRARMYHARDFLTLKVSSYLESFIVNPLGRKYEPVVPLDDIAPPTIKVGGVSLMQLCSGRQIVCLLTCKNCAVLPQNLTLDSCEKSNLTFINR